MRLAVFVGWQYLVERMHPHVRCEELVVTLQSHEPLVYGVVVAVAEGLAESEGWCLRMIDTWQNDILRLRERIHVLSIVVYTHPLLQ